DHAVARDASTLEREDGCDGKVVRRPGRAARVLECHRSSLLSLRSSCALTAESAGAASTIPAKRIANHIVTPSPGRESHEERSSRVQSRDQVSSTREPRPSGKRRNSRRETTDPGPRDRWHAFVRCTAVVLAARRTAYLFGASGSVSASYG